MYRIKIMNVGGRGVHATTTKTSSVPKTIKKWGRIAKRLYPNHLVVVQYMARNGVWRDYHLIEDFIK